MPPSAATGGTAAGSEKFSYAAGTGAGAGSANAPSVPSPLQRTGTYDPTGSRKRTVANLVAKATGGGAPAPAPALATTATTTAAEELGDVRRCCCVACSAISHTRHSLFMLVCVQSYKPFKSDVMEAAKSASSMVGGAPPPSTTPAAAM